MVYGIRVLDIIQFTRKYSIPKAKSPHHGYRDFPGSPKVTQLGTEGRGAIHGEKFAESLNGKFDVDVQYVVGVSNAYFYGGNQTNGNGNCNFQGFT